MQNEKAWEPLLHGFIVDASSPSFLAQGGAVFEIPAGKDYSDYVAIRAKPLSASKQVFSTSEDTASKKIAASFSVEGSYGAFSGAASMSASRSSDSSIKTVRLDYFTFTRQYEVAAAGKLLTSPEELLAENFKKAVKSHSVEEIEEDFGIFYAKRLDLGGEVRKSYIMQATSKDTEQSISAEVSAEYNGGVGSAKASATASFSSKRTSNNADMRQEWSSKGGESSVWLKLGLTKDANEAAVQKEWADTITDDNLYPFNFKLEPLWELVKAVDEQKGKKFESYLLKKWQVQANAFHPSMFLGKYKSEL